MPLVAKIKDIKPNPFRHLERYPIQRPKVEALRESLRSTTYWGNLLVRRNAAGEIEQAFGHHRLVAMREEFGDDYEIELIERDLDDDAMFQIMSRENMAEWATTASVEHETVRAAVEAFAKGRIHLPAPPNPKPHEVRHAPSFVLGGQAPVDSRLSTAYTAQTVAKFIGWVKDNNEAQEKVKWALGALELIEQGVLTEADFNDLTSNQAQAVVTEARKAKAKRDLDAKLAEQEAERQRKAKEKAEADAAKAKAAREEAAKRETERKAAAEEAARLARLRKVEEDEAREKERQARAAKQAEEAEKQRKAAEAKKKEAAEAAERAAKAKAEAEAAAAAEETARKAEVEARQESQRAAVQQKRKADEATAKRQEGLHAATHVGKAVGREMRSGKVAYKKAHEVSERVDPDFRKSDSGPPKNFPNVVSKLLTDTFKKVFGDDDPRVKQWEVVIKYRHLLSAYERKNAAATLRGVGTRIINIANRIED
jgi:chemotaxis protein histidine kinase CheA